ncbi:MAG: hypothetical protein WCK64_08205 [Synechococcaceae cyanobacterium ELA445]
MAPHPPALRLHPLLAIALALGTLSTGSVRAEDNLKDCLLWRGSSGTEHTLVANRIGATNLLTKNVKLDPGSADGSRPIYRDSDIQRLCRSY